MPEIASALCRKHADDCVALARITTEPVAKQLLLARAQEWLKLAYSEGDAELERALSAFNEEQMARVGDVEKNAPNREPLIQR